MANENNNIQATTDDSQIVLYQPDESISLQVLVSTLLIFISKENWCSRQLFGNSEQLEKKAIVWLHVIWITIILI